MPIYLRQDTTSRLVREMYGGFDELAAAWEDMVTDRPSFPPAKQRATMARWLTSGVPIKRPIINGNSEESDLQIFGLCGLLDVDLLGIFDFKRNGYFSRFSYIRQLVYMGRRALGGLAPLLEMYGPADIWPSDRIARLCYGRSWFAHEFTNADHWKLNDYILVKAKFREPAVSRPRAIHIAYRRVNIPDTMWRYYGTVIAIEDELRLYNESGGYFSMTQVSNDEIRFRTYYGGRPVEWRVVSIHEFDMETIFPFNDMDTIGFNW